MIHVPKAPVATRRRRRILRKGALVALSVAGLALAVWALSRFGLSRIGDALISVSVPWALLALALMCLSMVLRAESWYAWLRAAGARPSRGVVVRATMIGVLMSAALPGRLGEPARAFVVSRRLGDVRRWFATVAGTVFAQTLLNIVALGLLAVGVIAGAGIFKGHLQAIIGVLAVPALITLAIVVAPTLFQRLRRSRIESVRRIARVVAAEMENLRRGLFVFRRPAPAVHATVA